MVTVWWVQQPVGCPCHRHLQVCMFDGCPSCEAQSAFDMMKLFLTLDIASSAALSLADCNHLTLCSIHNLVSKGRQKKNSCQVSEGTRWGNSGIASHPRVMLTL
eukprot:3919622-Amphidinium_carterae.1